MQRKLDLNPDNPRDNYRAFFLSQWKRQKPTALLFRTDSKGYIYDTGTNKIIACHELVFVLLEKMLTQPVNEAIDNFIAENSSTEFNFAAETIKSVMESERILSGGRVREFEFSHQNYNYREISESSLEILLLETTTRCNLRCAYCVYDPHVQGMRDHADEKMSVDTARRAVDYFKAHSYQNKSVAVSFFGGEPCLDYPWLKNVVDYSQTTLSQKEVAFFITTNGTLITQEIASFFYHNNFTVFVSIDGPEDIHNDYRARADGAGSFQSTLSGLKILINTFGGEAEKRIRFSMVYTPPFSEKRLNRIAELWNLYPWIPQKMSVTINYPSKGSISEDRLKNVEEEDKTLFQWAFERYLAKYCGKGDSHPIADALMDKHMASIASLQIFDDPSEQYYPTGHCLPGVRRLFTTVDGTFLVCEKISTLAPSIGNVNDGIDVNSVETVYMKEYEAINARLCSSCWAIRLCTACYVDSLENGSFSVTAKAQNCHNIKSFQKEVLKNYCHLKELNPDGLNYLNDYKMI